MDQRRRLFLAGPLHSWSLDWKLWRAGLGLELAAAVEQAGLAPFGRAGRKRPHLHLRLHKHLPRAPRQVRWLVECPGSGARCHYRLVHRRWSGEHHLNGLIVRDRVLIESDAVRHAYRVDQDPSSAQYHRVRRHGRKRSVGRGAAAAEAPGNLRALPEPASGPRHPLAGHHDELSPAVDNDLEYGPQTMGESPIGRLLGPRPDLRDHVLAPSRIYSSVAAADGASGRIRAHCRRHHIHGECKHDQPQATLASHRF